MVTAAVACLLSSVRVYFEMVRMELRDDDLTNFERHGAEPLPAMARRGFDRIRPRGTLQSGVVGIEASAFEPAQKPRHSQEIRESQ
jgi:hypothetical protein